MRTPHDINIDMEVYVGPRTHPLDNQHARSNFAGQIFTIQISGFEYCEKLSFHILLSTVAICANYSNFSLLPHVLGPGFE
jgi:hypothetical protein